MRLNEMDADLRRLSRRATGDVDSGATYLQNLLRSGQTDVEKLRLAAFLGHPEAKKWVEMSETEMPSETLDPSNSWRAPEDYWSEVVVQLAAPVYSRNELMNVGFDVMEYILKNGKARSLVRQRLLEALSLVRNNKGGALQEVYDLTSLHTRYTPGVEMGMRNGIRALNGSTNPGGDSRWVSMGTSGATNDVGYLFRTISISGKYSPELNVKDVIIRHLMPDFQNWSSSVEPFIAVVDDSLLTIFCSASK